MSASGDDGGSVPAPLRVVFAGTPDFAVPTLDALVAAGHELIAVYTQPDRPAGRGRKLTASAVKRRALELGLPVQQPVHLRDAHSQRQLAAADADLMVVVAYGCILPPAVLTLPSHGCVNLHASLLPRWRGAAPIHRAVLAGDAETGVCVMRMTEGLDEGPVYARLSLPISEEHTSGALHDELATRGAALLVASLPGIVDGSLEAQPQDEAQATYAHKLSKAEGEVDWTADAATIARQVRGLSPWPVAWTAVAAGDLRLHAAAVTSEPQQAAAAVPGEVVTESAEGLVVATGGGLLRITRLQLPGGRALDAAAFLNAHSLLGEVLGGT